MKHLPHPPRGAACPAELVAALTVAAGQILGQYQQGNRVSLEAMIEDYANLYVQTALDTALSRPVRLRRLR